MGSQLYHCNGSSVGVIYLLHATIYSYNFQNPHVLVNSLHAVHFDESLCMLVGLFIYEHGKSYAYVLLKSNSLAAQVVCPVFSAW